VNVKTVLWIAHSNQQGMLRLVLRIAKKIVFNGCCFIDLIDCYVIMIILIVIVIMVTMVILVIMVIKVIMVNKVIMVIIIIMALENHKWFWKHPQK
jgi:hypothetical protein